MVLNKKTNQWQTKDSWR